MKLSLLIFAGLLPALPSFGSLTITGIYDGSGSSPKGIEIYVNETGAYEDWTLGTQANASTSTYLTGYTFDDTVYTEGTYLYVTSTAGAPELSGLGIIIADSSFNQNGDDRINLSNDTGTIVDEFGVPGLDGSGEAWEYTDSYAYRISGTTSGSFDASEWTYGGPNLLDSGNEPLASVLGTYTIPEPSATLLGGLGLLALLRRRR